MLRIRSLAGTFTSTRAILTRRVAGIASIPSLRSVQERIALLFVPGIRTAFMGTRRSRSQCPDREWPDKNSGHRFGRCLRPGVHVVVAHVILQRRAARI